VADTWRPFAARAATRSLRVELTVNSGQVMADPVLLRSILANLFDNAVDYAPVGGEIVVTRSVTGGLSIANTASGLAAEDVAKLFDRFWRKESARSGGEHVGIGLSLARTFATAMGWRLTAVLESGRLIFILDPC
jgi:signal transduction histidine kinase